MKKKVSIILSAILLTASISTAAFAENVKAPLTQENNTAKQTFLQDHSTQFTKLTELRTEVTAAIQENKNLESQIKEKIKGSYGTLSHDQINQIKTAVQQDKDFKVQIKNLNENKKSLAAQVKAAVKSKDSDTVASLKSQISDITKQISDLKDKTAANKKAIEPFKDQLKEANDNKKALNNKIQPLRDQNKQLMQKIQQERITKKDLWTSCNSQIQSKDYTSASQTFDQILEVKSSILTDLKAKTEVLKQILTTIS